jgi:putative ABC transport system permease protein
MANQGKDADPAEVEASLRDLVQDYPAFSLFAFQEWRENLTREGNAKLGALYVAVGTLAIPSLIALVNTLGINVLERTREIGVLRAVGATRRQVRRMIMAESLLLAAAGTAFGILSGVWLGYILVAAMNMTGFVLPYFFPYAGILTTVAVGLLFGVLGALIPARHAARLNIVAALHYE